MRVQLFGIALIASGALLGRRSATKLLSKDEACRVHSNRLFGFPVQPTAKNTATRKHERMCAIITYGPEAAKTGDKCLPNIRGEALVRMRRKALGMERSAGIK